MREVASVCPRCGRRDYFAVDSWSGVPSSALDRVCPGCRGLDRDATDRLPGPGSAAIAVRRSERSLLGPVVLGAALVVAPVLGVVLALVR